MEALEESLGRGVSTPPSPVVGSKTTPGTSEILFSCLRKTIGYCLGGITPIGAFPVGASFLVGTTKGLILVGLETLRIL